MVYGTAIVSLDSQFSVSVTMLSLQDL